VLEGLLAEDDSVPDVWYLAGLCAHAGGDFEAALDAAAAGERLLRGGGGGGAERGKPGEEAAPDSLAADFAELRVRRANPSPCMQASFSTLLLHFLIDRRGACLGCPKVCTRFAHSVKPRSCRVRSVFAFLAWLVRRGHQVWFGGQWQ
jgi:hypothetical protein